MSTCSLTKLYFKKILNNTYIFRIVLLHTWVATYRPGGEGTALSGEPEALSLVQRCLVLPDSGLPLEGLGSVLCLTVRKQI